MRQLASCFSFLILGFTITAALYLTVGLAILDIIQSHGGGAAEDYLGIAFIIILPMCFLVGSIASGYLCQPHIRNPYLFILVSPGLYVGIGAVLTSGGTIEGFLEAMIVCGLVWTASSIGGVYLGKHLRSRRVRVNNANTPLHKDCS